MKLAAWLWLALCVAAGAHVATRIYGGSIFRTDLMALLPQEERDPDIQRAKDRMIELGARRLVLLLGHPDPARARSAGAAMAEALARSARFTEVTFAASAEDDRALGRLFHAHRGGLLAEADRARLEAGRGREIAQRALAALHLPGAPIDAGFLRDDPFLLLPTFLASLPRPLPRASREDGVLTLREDGVTWLVVGAQLRGDPFTLAVQRPVVDLVDAEARRIADATPGLRMLRAGAVFYADEAANRALDESTVIGLVSMAAIAVLILGVFREPRALLFGALSLAAGTVAAFSVCLAWFGDLHVAALLFGVSLLGVAVDYSLHYQCEALAPHAGPARARIRRVLPGLALGAGAAVVGYLTLLASPFPGLHELAIFSVVGIAGAVLTVVLWLPALDRDTPPRRAAAWLGAALALWRFWEEPRWRGERRIVVAGLVIVAAVGATRFRIEDDVRRMQELSPALLAEAAAIERLSGRPPGGPFILVRAADLEAALTAQEQLLPRLEEARARGALAGFEATAQFVPSAVRQREARALIASRLGGPVLDTHLAQLGLGSASVPADTPILTLDALHGATALAGVAALSVPGGAGSRLLVPLSGVARPAEVAALAEGIAGATFVDPVADTSRLLAEYRRRALALVALSVALMLPLLAWRFGIAGALRVALPSVAALAVTPLILAALGVPFTFFSAMALVLVLAMGVDYAIFCREADSDHRPSTMLGIGLAAVTTMLSFGLLALSSVAAVRGFGLSLLVGIGLSLLFAPLAARRA